MSDTLADQLINYSSDDGTAQPITITLKNGMQLNFKNADEMGENLSQALESINREYVSKTQEAEQLKLQLQQYQQSQMQNTNNARYSTNDEDERFSTDVFIEKMRVDPREAFNYIDNFRDIPYKKDLEELKQLKQETEVNKFIQAHPEFPLGQAGFILNQVREELGQPMTKLGLEAALVHATQTNRLPDFRMQYALQQQQQMFLNQMQQAGIDPAQVFQYQQAQQRQNNFTQQQPVIQQNRPPQQQYAPPTLPRNNANTTGLSLAEQTAENMTKEQLEDFFRKQGLFNN